MSSISPRYLQHSALRIAHREGVDQHVDSDAILAAQHFFVIAQHAMLLHHVMQVLDASGEK